MLSDFRRQALAKKIGASYVTAKYIHYVALQDDIDAGERVVLEQLLDYNDFPKASNATVTHKGCTTYTFYVLPRIGTISPWSSKATSIAHVCGFEKKVKRIERGIVFTIALNKPFDSSHPPFADELYDRMTQTLS